MKSLRMELPFWVRAVLLAGVFCIVAGAGLIAYRFYQRPVTLTVAVGSLDGEARQVASLIAGRLATIESPVRLKVENAGSVLDAAKAFASGKADLAVVRADLRSVAGPNRRDDGAWRGHDRGTAGIFHHQHREAARSHRRRGRRRNQSRRRRGPEEGI
jgi:hypothetical protein